MDKKTTIEEFEAGFDFAYGLIEQTSYALADSGARAASLGLNATERERLAFYLGKVDERTSGLSPTDKAATRKAFRGHVARVSRGIGEGREVSQVLADEDTPYCLLRTTPEDK